MISARALFGQNESARARQAMKWEIDDLQVDWRGLLRKKKRKADWQGKEEEAK